MAALPLRVLYVDTATGLGGGQINLIEMLKWLDRDSVAPLVAAPAGSEVARWCSGNGVEVVPLRFCSAPDHAAVDSLRSLSGVVGLASEMRSRRVHIVHANNFKAALVSGVSASLGRLPMVFHEQAQITHWPLDALVGLLSARIIAVSEAVAAKHAARFGRKVRIIPPGVDLSEFEPAGGAKPAGGAGPAGAVCFLGRISEEKGVDLVVECAPAVLDALPGARFIIGGAPFTAADRVFCDRLRSRIRDLGLGPAFEFTGFTRDVAGVLGRSDLLIVPSRRDASPRVVVEAMAMGLPVVAARVGGLPERVSDGRTGILVPPEDPGALAGAVVRLLKDPALARAMGREGRRVAEETYSSRAAASAVLSVYLEIAGGT